MADTNPPPTPGFLDGLGDRIVVVDRAAGSLEVLRLRSELAADPAFEANLRARAEQLAALRHPGLARVRHVGRLPAPDNRLAIVSDSFEGMRLSELLQASEQLALPLHTNAALFLLRQLAGVMAFLHAAGPDISHGAVGPERLVVSPTGRLTLVEHVLGSALQHVPQQLLQRSWKELRVGLAADEQPPFGRRSDLLQVGLCGLALVMSRQLRLDEYPARLHDLFDKATESRVTGERRPLRAPLRGWLEKAIGIGQAPEGGWTIDQARSALDSLLSSEGYLAAPTGLVTLMEAVQRYYAGGEAAPAAAPKSGSAATPRPAPSTGSPTAVKSEPSAKSGPAAKQPTAPSSASALAIKPEPTAKTAPAAATQQPAAPVPVALTAPAPAVSSARPAPALRLVSFPSGATAAAAPARPDGGERVTSEGGALVQGGPQVEMAQRRLDVSSSRTEGALAVATPLPRAVSAPVDDSFAPEPGLSFPPDDPDPDLMPADLGANALPQPTDGATSALPKMTDAATSPLARMTEAHASGATPIAAPSLAADPVVEPIAASIDHDRLADLVHTRHRRSEGSGAHRAASGGTRSARSMFGVTGDEPEAGGASGVGLLLKLAGGVGAVVVLLVLGWFVFGGSSGEEPAPTLKASVSSPARATGRERQRVPEDRPAPAATQVDAAATAPEAPPASAEMALPASLAGAAAEAEEAGSIRVALPFSADVFERGVKLGTTDTPIVLGAGRHVLEMVSPELAYAGRQVVEVLPGRATTVTPKVPAGRANINATPWAEVWIDGARAGETPLGNLALAVGQHQVVFRHPELGEQTRTLVVTATAPARLSVEMKQ